MNNYSQQLEALNGNTIKLGSWEPINKKQFTVSNHKINASNTILFTDQRTFNLLNSEVEAFLSCIEIIEENKIHNAEAPSSSTLPEVTKVDLQLFEATPTQKKTQEALSKMLDKILSDDKEVRLAAMPQAKAVCDIANAMVNMEKSQREWVKLATQRK